MKETRKKKNEPKEIHQFSPHWIEHLLYFFLFEWKEENKKKFLWLWIFNHSIVTDIPMLMLLMMFPYYALNLPTPMWQEHFLRFFFLSFSLFNMQAFWTVNDDNVDIFNVGRAPISILKEQTICGQNVKCQSLCSPRIWQNVNEKKKLRMRMNKKKKTNEKKRQSRKKKNENLIGNSKFYHLLIDCKLDTSFQFFSTLFHFHFLFVDVVLSSVYSLWLWLCLWLWL